MLITISIMMRSGIPMGDAVQILWDNNPSPWFRAHLALIRRKLEQGADVRLAALPVLRHRMFTNFSADSEGIDVDDIIAKVLKEVHEPGEKDYHV